MNQPIIAFFPEASFGAALNCVGIAQALRNRGAQPVFICHPGFTGVFAEYGFKEFHLPDLGSSDSEDYWQRFIQTHLSHFRQDAKSQLTTYVAPTWDAIVDTVEMVEDALTDLLAQIRPDLIVLDNVIMFPAISNAGCPWVRVVSCAETELPDPLVPPYLSGLDPSDSASCAAFSAEYATAVSDSHKRYNRFRKIKGLAALPDSLFLEPSPDLNLLLSPAAVRYERAYPLTAPQYAYLEGCVRTEVPYEPPVLNNGEGPLVYMSFGSLGAADTDLIKRMLAVFEKIPARFLVNVGGFLEDYTYVPDNAFLGSWYPQPSVVRICDLFIHHGGNNSFCEALYFGVPSLIMPYCWDGFDNAHRANATGLGHWFQRDGWRAQDLELSILRLLQDDAGRDRLRQASEDMKASPGTATAAEHILQVLRQPVGLA